MDKLHKIINDFIIKYNITPLRKEIQNCNGHVNLIITAEELEKYSEPDKVTLLRDFIKEEAPEIPLEKIHFMLLTPEQDRSYFIY